MYKVTIPHRCVQQGNTYTATPVRDFDPLNGVSTNDIVNIQRHLLGTQLFNSPYKYIAADVNNSQGVTASDITALRKVILGVKSLDDYNGQKAWRFVEDEHQFEDVNNPWYPAGFPEDKTVVIDANDEIANFIGIKIGDVTGDARTNSLTGTQGRSASELQFVTEESALTAGETYRLAVSAANFEKITGYQFTMSFDANAVSFAGIESGAIEVSESNFGLNRLSQGMLTTSWNSSQGVSVSSNEVLFTLIFNVEETVNASAVFSLNSKVTAAEAYNAEESMDVSSDVQRRCRCSRLWLAPERTKPI